MTQESPKLTDEQEARGYVGTRGIGGDTWNNVALVQGGLGNPDHFSIIKKVDTYEEYVREKCARANKPQIAEAIMRASKAELVAQYDTIITRMNDVIGERVTTQEQADRLKALLEELKTVVYGG